LPQRPDANRRAVSLRQRLLLLTAGALLPLALAAGLALQALLTQQRLQTEQSSLDLTRALATAVDTELRLTISALQTLAATEPLASDHPADIEAFYRLARRVLTERPEWRAILLADPSGKVLFSTNYPFGGEQPTLADRCDGIAGKGEAARALEERRFEPSDHSRTLSEGNRGL